MMLENPEICGLLHKKRGGFGKMMYNAWQYRFFIITKDGILLYFDTEVPDEGHVESKARGRLDLRSVTYEISTDPIQDSPTTFPISLSIPNEEKWKMCAETKDDQARWIKAFEKFTHNKLSTPRAGAFLDDDNTRRGSSFGNFLRSEKGDETDEENEKAAKTEKPKFLGSSLTINNSTITSSARSPTNHTAPTQSTSAENNTTNVSKSATTAQADQPIAKPSGHHKKHLRSTGASDESRKDANELYVVIFIFNVCFLGVILSNHWIQTIAYVVVANSVMITTLILRGNRLQHALTSKANHNDAAHTAADKKTTKSTAASATASSTVTPTDNEVKTQISGNAENEGKSEVSLKNDPAEKNKINGKFIPGFTIKQVPNDQKNAPPHTWSVADHRQFQVRIGPDYNRYKRKAPSGPAIYEPFAVDVFCTKQRVDHAALRFQLPDTSNLETNHPYVPPIFVIQLQIPSEPPTSLFSSAEDGPGWAAVMYYRITEDSRNQLKDFANASPAIKLFAEWCEKCTVDPAWRGRFKVICQCSNFEELGFPSMITGYNGKPVLIRRTGSIFRGSNYMEMNIHVHKFANLAKQSIHMITSKCNVMYMNIGFVIEGREDKELPETLFACCAVNRPQEEQAEFIFDEDDDNDE